MSSCVTTKAVIYKGADAALDVSLQDENGNAYDLTGTTALSAFFKNANGTILEKELLSGVVIGSPEINGKLTITLTEIETATLPAGRNQSIELEISVGADIKIVQLLNSFDVVARLFV